MFYLNEIRVEFARLELTEEAGLNVLSELRLISDLTEKLNDVAPTDAERALAWLKEQAK